jgi:alpha-tubulin suppressor-like RCC1 family protein
VGPAGPAGGGDPAACAVPEYLDVASGQYFSCGIRTDGTLRCWGNNTYDQLAVPRGVFVSLTVGNLHACALDALGQATCWGHDGSGESDAPAGITFSEIAAGSGVTCGVVDPGDTVLCWGSGLNGVTNEPAGAFHGLSLKYQTACAIRTADNRTICWGQQGLIVAVPVAVNSLINRVEVGLAHACGLLANGNATCWGSNQSGSTTPFLGPFVDLESDSDTTCGLRTNGTGVCWGTFGGILPDLQSFDIGYYFGCGLDSAGHARCWGENANGQSTPPACVD